MKGGTGIYLDANDKEAFEHFMKNSKLSFSKASGSFGITYELTLNPGIVSKYLSLDASNYSQPINKLLLKTTFIYPIEFKMNVQDPIHNQITTKTTTNIDNFYEEVNIQTDVYLKTMEYLQPLCPAIVYANDYDIYDPSIIYIVSTFDQGLKQQLYQLPGIRLGVIAMELMDNAHSVHDVVRQPSYYESYIAKIYYTLIEFMMKTGYNHGDFHFANILLNLNVTDYFFGKRGQATLIDFGFTEKLSQKNYNALKELYKEKKYVEMLDKLCDIDRKDGYVMTDFEGYTETCLRSEPRMVDPRTGDPVPGYVADKDDINKKIEQLYELREKSIDNIVDKFNSNTIGILLPLSNTTKNKMYNGNNPNKKVVNQINGSVTIRDLDIRELLDDIQTLQYDSYTTILINACYMYTYLLNIQFPEESDKNQKIAILIYSNAFDRYGYREICHFVVNKFKYNKKMTIQDADILVRKIINKYIFLENIVFNTFEKYIPNDVLPFMSDNQVVSILTRKTTYEDPIMTAEEMKISNPGLFKKRNLSNEMTSENAFQALPFGEEQEEVSGGKRNQKTKKNYKKQKLNKRRRKGTAKK
jgi:hypothetical protein